MKKMMTIVLAFIMCMEFAGAQESKIYNGDKVNITKKTALVNNKTDEKQSANSSVERTKEVPPITAKLQAFPNPAKGALTIKYTGLEAGSLLLFNDRGLELMDLTSLMACNQDEFKIRTGNLIPGTYFIKYRNGDINLAHKVVISR